MHVRRRSCRTGMKLLAGIANGLGVIFRQGRMNYLNSFLKWFGPFVITYSFLPAFAPAVTLTVDPNTVDSPYDNILYKNNHSIRILVFGPD
jgi:hypothetical protein